MEINIEDMDRGLLKKYAETKPLAIHGKWQMSSGRGQTWFRDKFFSKANEELVAAMREDDKQKIKVMFEKIYMNNNDGIVFDEHIGNRPGLRLIANIVINTMKPPVRFCDMACGHGELLKTLKGYRIECYGTDGTISRVKTLVNMGIPCNFVDVENCGYPSDFFDGVSCCECLEHVRDPFAVVMEMYRILKNNGILFVTVPYEYFCDCDSHVRQFSLMDLQLLAAHCGFSEIRVMQIPYLNHEQGTNILLTARKKLVRQ